MDETTQETFVTETEPVFTEEIQETTAGTVPAETEAPVFESESAATEEVPETTESAPSETQDIDYYFEDEFIPTSTPVAEATETVGIPEQLEVIESDILGLGEALNLIAGMLLFFVVTLLCYFVYKFFRIFF